VSDAQERTEQATPKRRERARLEGDQPRSALAACAVGLLFAAIPAACAMPFASWWISAFGKLATTAAGAAAIDAHPLAPAIALAGAQPWLVIAAAACAATGAATASAAASGALGWSPGALRVRLARLSPQSGLRSLVSADAIAQTAFALVASIAVFAAAARPAADLIASRAPAWRSATAYVWRDLAGAWSRVSVTLAVVAVADVALARRRHGARLRMTPREVRDERAEQEGRPEVKARRRGVALRRSRRLRLEAIRRASAVVANPTHVAVALRYAPPAIDVPVVVASAAGAAAIYVRAVAAFHDVPVIESPDLARSLFARVDVEDAVPEEFYAAVAAVFAWILRTRGRLGGSLEA